MEHPSTFDLMIGKALIAQIEVMAEIEADSIGEWYVAAIYMDAIEIDGRRCGGSRDYVRVPGTHPLYRPLMNHFLTVERQNIMERWDRHAWRYSGDRAAMFNDAGRTL